MSKARVEKKKQKRVIVDELSDPHIERVDGVSGPAHRTRWAIVKSEEAVAKEAVVEMLEQVEKAKADDEVRSYATDLGAPKGPTSPGGDADGADGVGDGTGGAIGDGAGVAPGGEGAGGPVGAVAASEVAKQDVTVTTTGDESTPGTPGWQAASKAAIDAVRTAAIGLKEQLDTVKLRENLADLVVPDHGSSQTWESLWDACQAFDNAIDALAAASAREGDEGTEDGVAKVNTGEEPDAVSTGADDLAKSDIDQAATPASTRSLPADAAVDKGADTLEDYALTKSEADALPEVVKKDYTDETRAQMAREGKAIPIKDDKGTIVGGKYPIGDTVDLGDAVQSYGRSQDSRVKQHITRNARALGATDQLPADWEGSTKEEKSMAGIAKDDTDPIHAAIKNLAAIHGSACETCNSLFGDGDGDGDGAALAPDGDDEVAESVAKSAQADPDKASSPAKTTAGHEENTTGEDVETGGKSVSAPAVGPTGQGRIVAKSIDSVTDEPSIIRRELERTFAPLAKSLGDALKVAADQNRVLEERLRKVEEQPMPGGPFLNGMSPFESDAYLVRPRITQEPARELGALQKALEKATDPYERDVLGRALAKLQHPFLQE